MIRKIQIIKLVKVPENIDEWVEWLNNKKVTKYSNQKNKQHTRSSQEKFIKSKLNSKKNLIFKINFNKKFVGVLELSFINNFKKDCQLSYMIGNIKNWGKGIATEAIRLALIYSKNKLLLKKVYSGVEIKNMASKKVLLKNKFFIIKKTIKNIYLERSL